MTQTTSTTELLEQWNATTTAYPLDRCVHELFDAQARARGQACALVSGQQRWSYQELASRARTLSAWLESKGIAVGERIALSLPKEPDLIAAMIAVMRVGAAYVPIALDCPRDRRAFIAQDAGIRFTLTRSEYSEAVEAANVATLLLDECPASAGPGTDDSDAEGEPHARHPAFSSQATAYVIYTSGTTGNPKGVLVTHRNVINFSMWGKDAASLDPGDAITQFAPYTFDASVGEIFGGLLGGAELHLLADQLIQDPRTLERYLLEHDIRLAVFPPPYLQLLDPERVPKGMTILSGGSEPTIDLVERWGAKCRYFNLYGPTETTVASTAWKYDLAELKGSRVPIGRPISNTQIYILNEDLQQVPIGATGEIYIGGAGVALGYLNQPELTAQRFITDPFNRDPAARMYRTGDLGRWQANGTIEFLGRNDHQVKIRGFRIELGEIENQLLQVPGVREAVVLVCEDSPAEKRLVAYLTGDGLPDVETLRTRLSETVPHYMVPSAYVVLDRMPLTPHGKFDRRALPAPEDTAFVRRVYEAPRSEVEIALAQIWSELLRVERIGRHDHFFELGGHSLLAARMSARLRQRLGLEVDVSSLFAHPVLRDCATLVEQAPASTLPALVPGKRPEMLPLSFAQRSLWFIARMGEDARAAYHLAIGFRMRGALDESALRAALDRIVQRHEALRTHFEVIDGQPVQHIAEFGTFTLLRNDLTDAYEDGAVVVEHWRRIEASAPFDLARGPLVRGRLLRLGEQEHVLLLTAHHIVFDGWSLGVAASELSQLYQAYAVRSLSPDIDPLPAPSLQYPDYALWQRDWLTGEVQERQVAYWREHLSGAPALISLPTDKPRPPVQEYRGESLALEFDLELTASLRGLSQRHGTTLYMTVLAAWGALLARLSGQNDVVIGMPVANRTRSEVEPVIGFFVNTLPLRLDLSERPSVAQLLAQARGCVLEAQSHQDLPFEQVVEAINPKRSLTHHPIFQVMLSWNNTPDIPLDLAGLSVEYLRHVYLGAQFDLSLDLEEVDSRICGHLNYATALFDAPTIVRYWGYLQAMLRGMVADESQPVERIELLDAAERTLVLQSFNATHREHQKDTLLHELFEQQVRQDPGRIAVELAGEQLSYGRLNIQANQLAHHLRKLGVRPDDRVAICLERSVQMLVAILAVLKAGGAYVPLDPAYPDERLAHMLRDSEPVALLTQSRLRERLEVPRSCVRVVLDESAWQDSAWSQCPTSNPSAGEIGLKAAHLAYVIYTSGSSGVPKGVMIEHSQVSARMAASKENYAIGPQDRVLQFSALTFDASVEEIFSTLLCGATLVLRTDEWLTDPERWYRLCASHAVTIADLPTPFWQRLAQDPHVVIPAQLRQIIIGGDAVSASALESWWRRCGHRPTLINTYGPTEATIVATIARYTSETGALNIGHPVANTRIYVLDAHRRPVPIGVRGEIYIAGVQVARGYLNQPELTAQRFVEDPFSGEAGGRMYRTGDLGRWRADGAIEYLGRDDFQMKIRGFRIELGEIEAQLSRVAGVREAVVIAREDTAGEKRLIAYVVKDAEVSAALDPALLRGALNERLPEYMLPAAYVLLDALPLTPNGKVDRKALPAPEGEAFVRQAYEAPIGAVEQTLAQIWSELLKVERVGRHDNFFDLGGHSLLITRLIEDARRRGLVTDLRQLFEASTLAGLAAIVRPGHDGVLTHGTVVPVRAAGSQRPLFCLHEGFGSVLVYERLARFIDADIPVYSVEARGLHEDAPLYRPLADMARDYLRQIAAVQSVGPYRLAGWSAGGILAYEIAHQLLAQGESVEFLGMIDTYKLRPEDLAGVTEKHYLIHILEYTHPDLPAEGFRALLAFDDFEAMVGECHRRGWLKAEVTSHEMRRRFQVAYHITHACAEYVAPALALDVDLFSAQEPVRLDRSNGWARLLGPRLKITPVGGTHFSMIQKEALIAQVAGPMNEALLGIRVAAPSQSQPRQPCSAGAEIRLPAG